MSSTNLILDIIARDRASREFDKVAGAANRTGGVLDGLGKKVIGAMSVTAVVAFGVASVRAFADAEQSQIQLQEAFRKFPALADSSFDALHAFNQEMEDKVAIDGDSLDAADAVLARFGLMGSEIEAVTPLLADYVTISGKTAPEAAETLGKALLGNARALKDLGIVFTPTGDRARDLATIMGLLEEKVGGAAEAFAGSAAGKLQAFDLAIENMQETIGGALVPALTAVTGAVKELSGVLPQFVSGLQAGAAASAALGSALSAIPMPDWLKDSNVDVYGGIAKMFGAALSPLGLLTSAFGGGAAAAASFDAAMRGLGATFDSGTGKWRLSAEALAVFNAHADEFDGTVGSLQAILAKYSSEIQAADGATGGFADATADAADKQSVLARMAEKTRKALAELKEEFDAYTGKTRNLNSATADLNEAVAKLADLHSGRWPAALNSSKTGLDLNTKAGRAAWEAFDGIADKAEAAATAAADKGKWGQASKLIQGAREDLVDQAVAWGMSRTKAEAYVDSILDVPPKVTTMIQVNSNIDAVRAVYNSIVSKNIVIHITQAVTTEGDWHRPRALADGFVKEIGDATKKVVDKTAEAAPVFNWAGGLLAAGLLDGLTDKTDDSDESISAFIDRMKDRLAKMVDAAKTALDKAKDELADYKKAYWATLEGIQGNMQGFGALTGFDLSGARQARAGMTQADAAVADAQTAVSTAQGDVLLATTDEERAAAINAVTEAEKALTAALEAQAAARETLNSSDTTAANIASSMRGRIAQIKEFAAALRTLKGMGLGAEILSEILRAGPVDGLELAKALIEGGPSTVADINAAQAELNSVSRDIGRFGADLEFPDFKARVEEMAANVATLQAKYDELARLQKVVVELHIDGKKIVETLLRYRREHGGEPLGLG